MPDFEQLRDAIQDLMYVSSLPKDDLSELEIQQDSLRLILETNPDPIPADFLRDLKLTAVRIGHAKGDELDECKRKLKRAQDELLVGFEHAPKRMGDGKEETKRPGRPRTPEVDEARLVEWERDRDLHGSLRKYASHLGLDDKTVRESLDRAREARKGRKTLQQ